MSRIYQGGQSNSEYKSKERRVKYNPEKAISNTQNILDEGKRTQRNLQTLDKEAKRKDETSNLERQSADQVAALVLKDQLDQAARELKLEQQVDTANNEISKMLAQANLQMDQTTEKGKVSINQLKDKNALEYKKIVEKNSLELEQLKATNKLKSEHSAKRADNNLQLQHMQFKANVDNANFQVVKTAVMGLIQFGGMVYKDQAALVDKKNEEYQASVDNMPGKIKISDGTAHSSIIDDAQIDVENRAREAGIQSTATSVIEAQQLRAPALRVETARNLAKADIRSKGNLFPSRLNEAVQDPNTKIPFQGRELNLMEMIRAGATEDDVYDAIADIADYLGNSDQLTKADGAEGLMAYGNQAKMARNNTQLRWGAIQRAYSEANNYDSGKTLAASRTAAKDYQGAWEAIDKASYISAKFIKLPTRDRQEQALKDLLKLGDADDARALLNVEKVPGNSGTTFEKDDYYRPIILKAIENKLKLEDTLGTAASAVKEAEVDSIMGELNQKLRNTIDTDLSLDLRNKTKDYLRQNFPGNVYAQEQIDSLVDDGRESMTLQKSIQERITNGDTPSMEEVLKWERSKSLDPAFITILKKDIKLRDEVTIEMKAAGLGNIESTLRTIVGKYEGQIERGGIHDPGDVRTTIAITARQLAPKLEQEMRTFIAQMPKDLPQVEKDRLITGKFEKELLKITNVLGSEDADLAPFDRDGFKFSLLGTGYGSLPPNGRINPITGQMSFAYMNTPISELLQGAGTEDLILSRTNFVADAEVWNQGGTNYSARTLEAAKRFNVTPKAFIEAQAVAHEYDNVHAGIASKTKVDFSSPQTTYTTFQAAGMTKNSSVLFGDKVTTMGATALDDAIESNSVRLAAAEKYLGGSFASASPQKKLEAVMNDIKSFDRNTYRILRSPSSSDIQINRSINEYFKGQQPVNFPVIDTRISTGNTTAFQYRGVSTQTFLSANVPGGYGSAIAEAAAKHGIDPGIYAGQLHQESDSFAPDVIDGTRVSSAGAQGVAQIMTEFHPGVNPLNPTEAIDYGAKHMAYLLKKYNGDYRLALTAYNAGEGNVDKYGGPIPGNEESMEYADLVFGHARTYGWGQ
jgi:hypothetical protein